MTTSRWQIVFRKEFLEVFRDKRALFNLVVSPLLITPLIFALVGTMAKKNATDSVTETIKVGIVGAERAPEIAKAIGDGGKNARGEKSLDFVTLTEAEAIAKIKDRSLRAAAMIATDDAGARFANGETVPISILVDRGSESSRTAGDRLETYFKARGDAVAGIRLQEIGRSLQFARPFEIAEKPIPGSAGAGMLLLSMMLPYLLVPSVVLGGVFVANDSVAGEKERGTLETLLVSPVRRTDIATGKFLAVAAASLLNGILAIVGMIWPFYVKLPAFSWMSQGGLSLTPNAIFAMIAVQLPLAVLGAGVLLAISTIARNQKEAQTYLTPVLLMTFVCATLSVFLKTDAPIFWGAAPIVSAALVLKQALEGVVRPGFVALAFGSSLLYAAAAVIFAAKLFQKESVLLKA